MSAFQIGQRVIFKSRSARAILYGKCPFIIHCYASNCFQNAEQDIVILLADNLSSPILASEHEIELDYDSTKIRDDDVQFLDMLDGLNHITAANISLPKSSDISPPTFKTGGGSSFGGAGASGIWEDDIPALPAATISKLAMVDTETFFDAISDTVNSVTASVDDGIGVLVSGIGDAITGSGDIL